jgi:hypothetical protein
LVSTKISRLRHWRFGRPLGLDAVLADESAINRFRGYGDADAMDEVGGHNYSISKNFFAF